MTFPPRPSLGAFVALAMLMVVSWYVMTILLAISCVYLPWLLALRMLNIETILILIAGALVSVALMRSLVPLRNDGQVPGLLLDRANHPRLFAEIEDIATALDQPVPQEVYLIGHPNAWVTDRGRIAGVERRRVMGLGLPLLAVLNVSQMRAVLAHEFAHFYSGDTKLVPWLYRAQTAMIRSFENMGTVGRAMYVIWMQMVHVAVLRVLRWYWLLFLRGIRLVSRRQESRADELACIVAVPSALISGLHASHVATVAWPTYWQSEVAPVLQSGYLVPMAEGFPLFLAVPEVATRVKQMLDSELVTRRINAYDSHPPLADRIAAIQAFGQAASASNAEPALSLLNNAPATEFSLLKALNPNERTQALQPISWDECVSKVMIPSWERLVALYAHLLEGVTTANLIDAVNHSRGTGRQIRDPKGMLLDPEQRVARAHSLFGAALGLRLVAQGWTAHHRPGVLFFERGDLQINPFVLVKQLAGGLFSAEEWATKLSALNIQEEPLVDPKVTRSEKLVARQDGAGEAASP
jgi:Zn-dependent protease with chaperone function